MIAFQDDGQTPLDANEVEGFVGCATTRATLNMLEEANIHEGLSLGKKSRNLKRELLSFSGLYLLHRHLFNKVWSWAGSKRNTENNIGTAPHRILEEIGLLCEDINYCVANNVYPWPEVAVRLHYRLVFIHAFPTGNGLHARIAADLLMLFNKQPLLTWGSGIAMSEGQDTCRKKYIAALRLV